MAEQVVRIGVTGHRDLEGADEVARVVDRALDDLLVLYGPGTALVVVSSVAEGADRLVAERVLRRPGARLEVILPLEPVEYRRDFGSAESCDEFEALLGQATSVDVVPVDPSGDREAAYEAAGHAMLDRADVVLALWDGEPSRGRGGTAEIVEQARRTGQRVVVVPVTRAEVGS